MLSWSVLIAFPRTAALGRLTANMVVPYVIFDQLGRSLSISGQIVTLWKHKSVKTEARILPGTFLLPVATNTASTATSFHSPSRADRDDANGTCALSTRVITLN
ncbi:hypothetical protein BD414DRAFT_487089 [Trametes punicea]|nr:hypothetical protein BD414DRAFT_487089 [Trametes punicea]